MTSSIQNPSGPTRSWALDLLSVSLLIGLAEALAMFFWSTVRGAFFQEWSRGLFFSITLGVLTSAAFVYLLGAGLFALRAGLGTAVRGARPAAIKNAVNRITSVPMVVLVFLWLKIGLSEHQGNIRTGTAIAAGVLILLQVVVGVPAPLMRLKRFWPIVAAPLLSVAAWMGCGSFGWRNFSAGEADLVLLQAGLPVLLAAIAWAVAVGQSRNFRVAAAVAALVASLGWCAAFAPASRPPAPAGKPNVALIIIDTLREDRVIGENAAMPSFKKLIDQAIYYSAAYTPIPKTQQSVSSIMTALYPWHHGSRTLHAPLNLVFDTMAEKFGRAGYYTAAFVHNPWLAYGMGQEQGFAEYHDWSRIESIAASLQALLPLRVADYALGRKRESTNFQVDGRRMTEQVLEWLDHQPAAPFFLWVHYFDPHWPYSPPPGEGGATDQDRELVKVINCVRKCPIQRADLIFNARRAGLKQEQIDAATRMYSAEARYTDTQLQRLIEKLSNESTILLITADHGESLGEHNYYFHHGELTFNTDLRVPLMLSWPGKLPQGKVFAAPVLNVDLAPTLFSLAGIERGKDDGRLLPGVQTGDEGDPGRAIPFEGDIKMFGANKRVFLPGVRGKWRGVIKNQQKMIAVPHPKNPRFQYYDLAADPGELHNLYQAKQPETGAMVKLLYDAGLTLGGKTERETNIESAGDLSEEELNRLRSLGYVQ